MDEKQMTGYPSIDKPWLKHYTEENINSPFPECTLYQNIYNNNKSHLTQIALKYFGNKISYKMLFKNVEDVAKAFAKVRQTLIF